MHQASSWTMSFKAMLHSKRFLLTTSPTLGPMYTLAPTHQMSASLSTLSGPVLSCFTTCQAPSWLAGSMTNSIPRISLNCGGISLANTSGSIGSWCCIWSCVFEQSLSQNGESERYCRRVCTVSGVCWINSGDVHSSSSRLLIVCCWLVWFNC